MKRIKFTDESDPCPTCGNHDGIRQNLYTIELTDDEMAMIIRWGEHYDNSGWSPDYNLTQAIREFWIDESAEEED